MIKAIVLNGTSSSGKTSIAKSLQKKLTKPFLHVQLDAFWNMVPSHVKANSSNFPYMKHIIMDTTRSMLKHEAPFILDTVLPAGPQFIQKELNDENIIYIHIQAASEILEQRELERGDREIGLAKSQLEEISRSTGYNLIIDTTYKSSDESADEIISKLNL